MLERGAMVLAAGRLAFFVLAPCAATLCTTRNRELHQCGHEGGRTREFWRTQVSTEARGTLPLAPGCPRLDSTGHGEARPMAPEARNEGCCQLLGRGTRATFIARRSHIVTGVDDGDRPGRDRVEPSLRGPSPTNCQMVPLRALLRAPSGNGHDSRGTSVTAGCMAAWAAGFRELRPSAAFYLSVASVCACLGCTA